MNNELQVQESNDVVLAPDVMNSMKEFSVIMSEGKDVSIPKHLQGKPADCLAVIMKAHQWGMNAYDVAQKTHVVSGSMGYEAQLVNAVITSSTAIKGRFHYEYSGEWKSDIDPEAWIRVGAILRDETEIQWGEKLYPSVVKVKNSPLWKTNPKQQAAYLALKYWSRLYTPQVIMGVYTSDELEPVTEKDMGTVSAIRSSEEPEPTEPVSEIEVDAKVLSEEDHQHDLETVLNSIKQANNNTMLAQAYNLVASHLELHPEDEELVWSEYNKKHSEFNPKKQEPEK